MDGAWLEDFVLTRLGAAGRKGFACARAHTQQRQHSGNASPEGGPR